MRSIDRIRARWPARRHGEIDPQMRKSRRRQEMFVHWLFASPALILLLVFIVVPFLMAFYLSLTNTRLISPHPPELIGPENYRRLLRLAVIPMAPETDPESGAVLYDEDGNTIYPRIRSVLRTDERYESMQELAQLDLRDGHYLVAAGDPKFIRGLANNLLFALVVVPAEVVLGLLLALLVNQELRFTNVFRAIYFSPVAIPTVVVSATWGIMYAPELQGAMSHSVLIINQILDLLTSGKIGPYNFLREQALALPAIMLLTLWQGVGLQMTIYLAGLQNIPPVLYEAAKLDGANRLQSFWFITLPQLRNTFIFVLITTTIFAFRLFTPVQLLTGGGPFNATITTIFHTYVTGFQQQRVGYASAITVIFFLIILGIAFLQRATVREERTGA